MAFTVLNIEFLSEIVTRQWNRPRGRIISDFLRRVVECFNELFVLSVGEFRWSAFTWFVVDNSLERLSFEPFEAVEPLRSPSLGVAVEFCCVFCVTSSNSLYVIAAIRRSDAADSSTCSNTRRR